MEEDLISVCQGPNHLQGFGHSDPASSQSEFRFSEGSGKENVIYLASGVTMRYVKTMRICLVMAMSFVFQGSVWAESDYPAAYFEPVIVFQAPEIAAAAATVVESDTSGESVDNTVAETVAVDPYPAAYFQPEIVFQDKEWIAAHAKKQKAAGAPTSSKVRGSGTPQKKSSANPQSAPITDDGGFPPSVLFLIVALAAGFFWFTNKNKNTTIEEMVNIERSDVEDEDNEGEEKPTES